MDKALIILVFLSSIAAQGGYDEPGHIGPPLGLYNPYLIVGSRSIRSFDVTLEKEEWDTPKEEIPYIYPWQNRIGQTAQQMVAILSELQQAGLSQFDIELFFRERLRK